MVVDVSNAENVAEMAAETVREFGRIDIMVNNAAYARGADRVPTVVLDDAIFKKVVDIKIMGTYLCSKAAAQVMLARGEGGKIVNVSSGAGKKGRCRHPCLLRRMLCTSGNDTDAGRGVGPLRGER